jgi:hypothetical protein
VDVCVYVYSVSVLSCVQVENVDIYTHSPIRLNGVMLN